MPTTTNPLSGKTIDLFTVLYPDDATSDAAYKLLRDADDLHDHQLSVWRSVDPTFTNFVLIVADESGRVRGEFDFGVGEVGFLLSSGQAATFVARRVQVEAQAIVEAGGLPVTVAQEAHYEGDDRVRVNADGSVT